jgi:hypothetical protein
MTSEELQAKLIPGEKSESATPGNNEWFPSGKCDAVIFREPKSLYVHLDGNIVKKGTKKVGDKFISPSDIERERIERRAIQYISPSSEDERTTGFGMTFRRGLTHHLGGIVDILARRFECLKKDLDAGYKLNHWAACTEIGKALMHPEIQLYLKVIPVEVGIYVVIYDQDDDIPVNETNNSESDRALGAKEQADIIAAQVRNK